MNFEQKWTASQKVRGTFQKCLHLYLENVTNCRSALWFVPPGCLRKRNLAGKLANFNNACMTAP